MSLCYKFKIISMGIGGKTVDVVNDSALLIYYPNSKILEFEVKYYTGKKSSFCYIPIRDTIKIKEKLKKHEYEIVVYEHGDEQTKQIKNLGGGALVGAVIAGPLGAAVGAYIGSKIKECPCLIKILNLDTCLKTLAPIGFLEEQSKNKFFDEQSKF